MIGEFAAFVVSTLCGLLASAFCVLYCVKFRRPVLVHATLFHAGLLVMSIRFVLRYFARLTGRGEAALDLAWDLLYPVAAVLFASQG
ncbi:MAG: hypothetical protein Q8M76_14795, partial [Spirochaetaceae bacterium]|nr:hypothetical protein [Spirochaetaceae bacterium]